MKKLIAIITLGLIAGSLNAQQLTQYSQYLQNGFMLNPALTGRGDGLDVKLGFRKQWSGFGDGAPQTYYISGHKALGGTPDKQISLHTSRSNEMETEAPSSSSMTHGLGGYVMNDQAGSLRRTAGYATYGLHLPLGGMKLSFGASAGVSNLGLNEELLLNSQNDQTYEDYVSKRNNKLYLDMNFGTYLTTGGLFLGYSSNQLLQNKTNFSTDATEGKLHVHHFIHAGYKYQVNDNLSVTPSLLAKYVSPSPVSVDVNAKVEYMEKIWGGISYRHEDAIIMMVGYVHNNMISVGYSFDYTTSGLSNYNSGSHEIVLGLKL